MQTIKRMIASGDTIAFKKMQLHESTVNSNTLQKALLLFGYLNATDTVYIYNFIHNNVRCDVHKYKINKNCYIMVLGTNSHKQIEFGYLYEIALSEWVNTKSSILRGIESMVDLDKLLTSIDAKLKIKY